MKFFQTHKNLIFAVLAGGILFVSSVLLFYKLGNEPFQDYDEATYAEITSESLAHGNFFSLTFLNSPYFRKPPLLFWLTDVSRELIPNQEFAMRLPNTFAALLLIGLVMLFCLEATASMGTALLGGIILAGTSPLIESARQVRFDDLVSLFILAAFYAFVRARKNPRWYLALGVFLGLAVLSKSVVAVFAGMAIVTYACSERRFAFLRNSYFWGGVGLFFVVVVPWHLYETLSYGFVFWQNYLGNEVIARVGTNLFGDGHFLGNFDYISYLLNFAAPWTEIFCVVVLVFPFLYRKAVPLVRHILLACITTVFAVFMVACVAQTKAFDYLIPLYPFLAIGTALGIYEINKIACVDIRDAVRGLLIVCIPFGLWLSIYNGFHMNPYYGYETVEAQEEMAIGDLIRTSGPAPIVYTYDDDDLGAIQFYSGLPFTKNQYVLLLSDTSVVTPGSFVVTTEKEAEIAKRFPRYTFTPVYLGQDVSLFQVSSSSLNPPRT